MISITELSSHYTIRSLDDSDVERILALCRENTQYYQYLGKQASRELVLNDLHITPPGVGASDKYFLGFYQKETLIAVMDLIDGYPVPEIAYIGFFMTRREIQGKGIGTTIIREAAAYLKTIGKMAIRLAIEKENPQATQFWKKNGFSVINEVDRDGRTILVAERML